MGNRVGNNLMHSGENRSLVSSLVDQQVCFMVIGGLAMSWHCPEREADDLDILIDISEQNDDRISNALVHLGFQRPDMGKFLTPGLHMQLKRGFYADILTPQVHAPSFADCFASSIAAQLFHIPIRVASVHTLIALKELAMSQHKQDSAKHYSDLALLRKAAV